jgi:hypothetical protein
MGLSHMKRFRSVVSCPQVSHLAILIFVSSILLILSWRKWPELIIDFGTELQIPWELISGKSLYKDLAYNNGPLSHYVNALWFLLFGPSFLTLVIINLTVLFGIIMMIYAIFRRIAEDWVALVVSLVFLCVFAFAHYSEVGNYNYISPYSHAQTYGVGLTLGLIYCFCRHIDGPQIWTSGVAGASLGALFLTKLEFALPGTAVTSVGIILCWWTRSCSLKGWSRDLMNFLAGVLALPIFFAVFLSTKMDVLTALRGVAGNFAYFGSGIARSKFYIASLGFDEPLVNILRMLKSTACVLLVLTLAFVCQRLIHRNKNRLVIVLGLGTGIFILSTVLADYVGWKQLGRALPVTAGSCFSILLYRCIKERANLQFLRQYAPLVLWSTLSFTLLLKMVLACELRGYGFVLAMPATLLLVVLTIYHLPVWTSRFSGGVDISRAFLLGVVASGVFFHLQLSYSHYSLKTFNVGPPRDAIGTYPPRYHSRSRVIAQTLEALRSLIPEDKTLLVLPEGAIFNYWLRRHNSTPFTNLIPEEMATWGGESVVLKQIQITPPDFIVLITRPVPEFGYLAFGVDPSYGRMIMSWVKKQYVPVGRFGVSPLRGRGYGTIIFKRDFQNLG